MLDYEIAENFMDLFNGNQNSYGRFDPEKDNMWTPRGAPTKQDYMDHLYLPNKGLAIVPILDAETSSYGALDFDNHRVPNSVNLVKLEQKIKKLGLPLVVCRSKRGGAHVYLFGKEPLNTRILRKTLIQMKQKLKGVGEEAIEIFPVQETLVKGQLGSHLNLPYMDCENTLRYAVIKGKNANVVEFIKEAFSKRLGNKELLELGCLDHSEAPPCIQRLVQEMVPNGVRNKVIYTFSVYARKAFPDNWKTVVAMFNSKNLEEPLRDDEISSILTSVEKNPDYKYKCGDDPMKAYCNSVLCVTLRYGITPNDKQDIILNTLPEFGRLIKYKTTPPRYTLHLDNHKFNLTADQLLNYRNFKLVVMEVMNRILPAIKTKEWEEIVNKWLADVEEVVVPDDASSGGIIRECLRKFIHKADLLSPGNLEVNKKALALDRPSVYLHKGVRYLCFNGNSFRSYVQSQKLGSVSATDIYMAIRDLGATDSIQVRLDKGSSPKRLWAIALDGDTDTFLVNIKKDTAKIPDKPVSSEISVLHMQKFEELSKKSNSEILDIEYNNKQEMDF